MHWPWIVYYSIGWIICVSMILVVLRRQLAPGASLAWLGIVFLHPYIGLTLYLLVGETRLGPRRTAEHQKIMAKFRDPARQVQLKPHEASGKVEGLYEPMVRQAERISGLPVVGENGVQFFNDAVKFNDQLIADINAARETVHLLYYLIATDATGKRIVEAVESAARRGVKCRVLVDAVSSRVFLSRHGFVRRLKAAGVEVAAALPAAPLTRRMPRMDMRNHRKLAIIDGLFAHAGSHNLIDIDYGDRRGNPWFDVTGRFSGPIVGELATVFVEDWAFETGKELDLPPIDRMKCVPADGQITDVTAQVVPTGPSTPGGIYRRLLITAIQSAQRELILSTPYFVPDEPVLMAILMAADRGVDVKLILPLIPDHIFTAAAGRAHFQTLLDAGIAIHLYRPGMLHSKITTVDDAFAIFGSANLDVRSFRLNFELSVMLYGREVTDALRTIQNNYLAQSQRIEPKEWANRSTVKHYTDSAISLFSPLL